MFCRNLRSVVVWQVAQLADRVSKQWRALPQAERDEWEARVEQQGNDYIAAVRAYVAVPPPVVFGKTFAYVCCVQHRGPVDLFILRSKNVVCARL